MMYSGADEIENPYFDEWLKQINQQPAREELIHLADADRDFDAVSSILTFRKQYVQRYAHAIPTITALEAIGTFGPILEIGAGTGYWAWLLRRRGVDIACYDKEPPGVPGHSNRFHGTGSTCWTDVLTGDETAVALHPERTLFLCWPPPHDEMPLRAITAYQGEVFIFVGELPLPWRKRVTTSQRFLSELGSNWEPIQAIELPHWEICCDNLYVFKRRAARSSAVA
jgi:hypothetical protein